MLQLGTWPSTLLKISLSHFSTNLKKILLSLFYLFLSKYYMVLQQFCLSHVFSPLLSLHSLWSTGTALAFATLQLHQFWYSLCFLSLLEPVLPLFVSSVIYVSSSCICHSATKLSFCLKALPWWLQCIPCRDSSSNSSVSFYILGRQQQSKIHLGKLGINSWEIWLPVDTGELHLCFITAILPACWKAENTWIPWLLWHFFVELNVQATLEASQKTNASTVSFEALFQGCIQSRAHPSSYFRCS